MTIKIERPGLFSTIQDLGRLGYQSQGFSQAGAIDYLSAMLANQLIGNNLGDSVIEMTLQGLSAKVLSDHLFAVVGGEMEILINGQSFPTGRPIYVANGDLIEFGPIQKGLRAYYAVPGGFDVKEELGSMSTHTRSGVGGQAGRPIKEGDYLKHRGNDHHSFPYVVDKSKFPADTGPIRILKGPEVDRFTEETLETLVNAPYTISQEADRMGIRLKGGEFETVDGKYDIISAPTQLGNIQVTKSGQPIILLNDRQTSGGYPRIATVAKVDIPRLSQMKPGEEISFEWMDMNQASQEYLTLLENVQNKVFLKLDTDHKYYRRIKTKKINNLLLG